MKKTYKKPLSEVVKINAEQMICQSVPFNSVNPANVSTPQEGGGYMLGKGDEDYGDLW